MIPSVAPPPTFFSQAFCLIPVCLLGAQSYGVFLFCWNKRGSGAYFDVGRKAEIWSGGNR